MLCAASRKEQPQVAPDSEKLSETEKSVASAEIGADCKRIPERAARCLVCGRGHWTAVGSVYRRVCVTMKVQGYVKWFDTTKGYGFVVADDGEGDVLLHANVLRVFGFTSVAEGARIELEAQSTERGRQAVEVIEITPVAQPDGNAPEPPPGDVAAGPLQPARVKWFDRVKGFGFVNTYGRSEDVFLHMETLRQFGYGEVLSGDVLAVRVTAGPRGPMVYEVRSWDYVARQNEAVSATVNADAKS
jgi:CspA family cold shock protein